MRGSKTRETSAINGGEWARVFAFCSHSSQGNGPRYPLDRPLGGLDGIVVLYCETQEDMKMPVKTRVAVQCKLPVLNNTVMIKPCLFSSMRCTDTNSTYLDRKTEQVVSDVSHADSSGGARFQSLSRH